MTFRVARMLLTIEYTSLESISNQLLSMSRPFTKAYYNRVVSRKQLTNTPVNCVPFQSKRLPLHVCLLSRQLLMTYTFIMANIINSKLVLFSSRCVAKVVLDGSLNASSDGDSPSICVEA